MVTRRTLIRVASVKLGSAIVLCVTALPGPLFASSNSTRQKQVSRTTTPVNYKRTIAEFEDRVKQYVKLREGLEGKLPKLSNEAKPEEIEAHKDSFGNIVRAARAGAQPGDVFTRGIASYIRRTIKSRFKGKDLKDLRETILEAETQGVPVRVNYPYPESKELTQIPPTLLLLLPQLPKQVKYRFVGHHMLLVDRENGLIIDYMLGALP